MKFLLSCLMFGVAAGEITICQDGADFTPDLAFRVSCETGMCDQTCGKAVAGMVATLGGSEPTCDTKVPGGTIETVTALLGKFKCCGTGETICTETHRQLDESASGDDMSSGEMMDDDHFDAQAHRSRIGMGVGIGLGFAVLFTFIGILYLIRTKDKEGWLAKKSDLAPPQIAIVTKTASTPSPSGDGVEESRV